MVFQLWTYNLKVLLETDAQTALPARVMLVLHHGLTGYRLRFPLPIMREKLEDPGPGNYRVAGWTLLYVQSCEFCSK